MSELAWTNDLVIRLMEEYKKHPQLWDSTNDLYRMQSAKYLAWTELSKTFECDIADLKKKLNSVFASHRREKAKIRAGGRSTWFLYPYMKFLPSHIENDNDDFIEMSISEPKRISHGDTELSSDDDHQESEQGYHEEIIIKEEPMVEYVKPVRKIKYVTSKPRLTKPLKRRIIKEQPSSTHTDGRLLETLRVLRRSDLTRKKDECDSFGEYIADSLRKHDERTQSMIKQAINNILFEQEMKKYNNSGQYVVISNLDENPLVLSDQDSSK